MTEEEYKTQRAYWVRQAMSFDRHFFPRCFNARLREIAKLDAIHYNRDYKEVLGELQVQWIE